MMRFRRGFPLSVLVGALSRLAFAGAEPAVQRVTFPSPLPSGVERNDRVICWYFRPEGDGPFPGVLVLHGLGSRKAKNERKLALRLSREGMAALVMTLPYHIGRRKKGRHAWTAFLGREPEGFRRSMEQAVADARACLSWLEQRPEVDGSRLGVVGVSLGGILATIVSGLDPRVKALVIIVGGGRFGLIVRKSLLLVPYKLGLVRGRIGGVKEALSGLDPVDLAPRIVKRKVAVLMVEAERDEIIPPGSWRALWEALGRPALLLLPGGHFSAWLNRGMVMREVVGFLRRCLVEGKPYRMGVSRLPGASASVGAVLDPERGLLPAFFLKPPWREWPLKVLPEVSVTTHGLYIGLSSGLTSPLHLGLMARALPSEWRPRFALSFRLEL